MRTMFGLASVLVVMLGATTQASIVEQKTGVIYQDDGGIGGDASDICGGRQPIVNAGETKPGSLVLVDDPADYWTIRIDKVPSEYQHIRVFPFETPLDITITLLAPDCGEVLASATSDESGDAIIDFVVPSPGLYILRIEAMPGPGAPELVGEASGCGPACTPEEVCYCVTHAGVPPT